MQPGKHAPKFNAPAYFNGAKTTIDLGSYRGKYVILLFYPEDFGATIVTQLTQLTSIRKSMGEDVAILAISTDSVESHAVFGELEVKKGGVKDTHIPLISDSTGGICRSYNVLNPGFHTAVNSGFIIDREGEIIMQYCSEETLGQDMVELGRVVQAAIQCDKHEAWDKLMGTGADWQPGDELVHVRGMISNHNICRSNSEQEIQTPATSATKPMQQMEVKATKTESNVSMVESKAPKAGSKAPRTDFKVQQVASRVPKEDSLLQNLDSKIPNADSKAQKMKSKAQKAESKVQKLGSKVDSQVDDVKKTSLETVEKSKADPSILTSTSSPPSSQVIVPDQDTQQGRGMGKLSISTTSTTSVKQTRGF